MAFDFPGTPAIGDVFQPAGGPTYRWDGEKWVMSGTALTPVSAFQARNRICNPCFQISQENGNTAGTTANFFGADQYFTTSNGAVVPTTQRVQSVTPKGSRDRYRVTITTADAAMATNDLLAIQHNIEGIRLADFRWGSAQARPAILRFGWKSPAGTYSISINNGPANRTYLANFTITAGQANSDTEQTFVIPGDLVGTWPIDTTRGMIIYFTIATGPTYHGVAGWNAGNLLGTASNTNGMATAAAVFELFDVGLYLDLVGTGIPPAWEMPDEAAELLACRRYWWSSNPSFPRGGGTGMLVGHSVVANYIGLATWRFTLPMRIVPIVTLWNNGVQNQTRTITTGGLNATGGITAMQIDREGGSNFSVTAHPASVWVDFDLQANARM